MPGLLTVPGHLGEDRRSSAGRALLYKVIFGVAVLALVLGVWLY